MLVINHLVCTNHLIWKLNSVLQYFEDSNVCMQLDLSIGLTFLIYEPLIEVIRLRKKDVCSSIPKTSPV